MILPSRSPFLIKLMNPGRHVRELQTKTESRFALLKCCLFYQDKDRDLSPPWAGLDNCLPKRLTSVYMCSFSIYNIPPLLFSPHFTLSLPAHERIVNVGLSLSQLSPIFREPTATQSLLTAITSHV